MNLKLQSPKQSLNKAYLKEKISRAAVELFKVHFTALLEKINEKGDEEHLKSLVADFLKLTYYNQSQHQINPIGKNDLVIHTGKSPADPFGVILEVKSPANKPEMITAGKPNAKALHELVLYYLDERITRNRNELKQLIITNIYDWFIIDANEFDKKIYRNAAIKKLYELKKTDGKDNPWFYDELKKLIGNHPEWNIEATFFDIRDYQKVIANADKQDDKGLIALYKILSPVHLLKVPFANDSNTLQPKFYSELLHLIGLYEYKEGSKKLISRKKDGERNAGSLLENAIIQLDSHDKISRLDKPSQYGETYQDRLYNVALELVITWVNRILFLKLLEAQLINYHKGDRSYMFLNKDKIRDFDDLDKLFFRVLAKVPAERTEDIQKLFGKVPYLNSSLFEPTELEHQTLFINGLEDFVALPVIPATVLKDGNSKVLKGKLDTLDYLFAFLNAYDFSSEGAEEIQEDNKTLINASVLGLIFEKINGYKDGSFFTPGFITMYMCRETIRRAVVQKFNEAKSWDCQTYDELYDKITDKKEANTIINSLKICDPAVGSGHFLVSALNEVLAIKSDLKILVDKDGRTLRDYNVTVENDELIVTDADADIFEYNPQSKESQRIQETLFHEKQTIIENCLFGVDINPNSVKICRLRLWIELLKNAYYKAVGIELETLPNIDINIKIGNSLISRFALDADLKQALRNTKWNINDYKIAVGAYKNATNKTEKRELVGLIDSIKTNFRSSISRNSKEYKELSKLRGQLDKLLGSNEDLFGNKKKNKKDLELEQTRLERSIQHQEQAIDEIKNNKIYENAFEWRFEFPEVLDDEGGFVGFDAVIGNPPYGYMFNDQSKNYFLKEYFHQDYQLDAYMLFIEKISLILKLDGVKSLIIPNTWLSNLSATNLRKFVFKKLKVLIIRTFDFKVFDEATVDTQILITENNTPKIDSILDIDIVNKLNEITKKQEMQAAFANEFGKPINLLQSKDANKFLKKFEAFPTLSQISKITQGCKPFQVGKGVPKQTKLTLEEKPFVKEHKVDETFKPLLRGSLMNRYSILWDDNYYISFGDWLAEPRYSANYFVEEKIIVRQTGSDIISALDKQQFVVRDNLYTVVLNYGSLVTHTYILALLNSKLVNWYYQNVINNEVGEALAQVKRGHLIQVPIAIGDESTIKKITDLTATILHTKKTNYKSSTTHLESEINRLVYDLYELTPEEIRIIEGV